MTCSNLLGHSPMAVVLACALFACSEDGSTAAPTTDGGVMTDMAANGDMGCSDCPVECPSEADLPEGFVCIPAGEFWMGSPEDQIPRDANQEERHRVRITQPFLMGIHEVTQMEWQSLIGNNPAYFSESGGGCELEPCENRPVERINWHEAIAYANARSNAEGLRPCYETSSCDGELGAGCEDRRECLAGYSCQTVTRLDACNGYRLPTEAEWEYAARGGLEDYRYGPIDDIAWYVGTARNRSRPVGGKEANPWGLHDVYGNVAEWTGDIFNQDYGFFGRPDQAIEDPNGGEFGDTRVVRGASWRDGYEWCRAAYRGTNFPARRSDVMGFRLVRQLR